MRPRMCQMTEGVLVWNWAVLMAANFYYYLWRNHSKQWNTISAQFWSFKLECLKILSSLNVFSVVGGATELYNVKLG